jgi:hypothetical protein
MLNRRALGWTSAVAMGVGLLPAVAVGSSNTSHRISETRVLIGLGTEGKPGTSNFRNIAAGTVDGWIGATSVHGAFRDLGQVTSSSSGIDRGTEFDVRGSRSFVQHLTFAINNGHVALSGTGKWTGGTGSYRHARGSFKLIGGGPLGGVLTSHLNGSISY